VAVEGTGILLEDGTETGDVKNNYIVGDGSGSGESDSQRFTPVKELSSDMEILVYGPGRATRLLKIM